MSRIVPLSLLLIAMLAPSLFAQDVDVVRETAEERAQPQTSLRQLTVNLTEYELKSPDAQTAKQLATTSDLTPLFEQLREKDKLRQTSEITFRAMEHQSTSVQFSEQIALVRATGSFGSNRGGTAYQHSNVGTLISVQWTQQEDQYALKLTYDQSSPKAGLTEDDPPSIKTMTIETTVGVKPGEIILLSSKNTDGNMELLTLSVTAHD